MALPEQLRHLALTMEVFVSDLHLREGIDVETHLKRAVTRFESAEALMTNIDLAERAAAARKWRIWASLQIPNMRDAAIEEVERAMTNGSTAVDYLDLADTFGIEFDPEPLRRYLAGRRSLGGLTERQQHSRLILARRTMVPHEFITFLEEERDALLQVLKPGAYAYLLFRSLIDSDQIGRAEAVLSEYKGALGEDYPRLQILLNWRSGKDVQKDLEGQYAGTGHLFDLNNLIFHLTHVQNWVDLHSRLIELFGRHGERNTENSRRITDCLRRLNRDEDLLEFLEQCPDLLELDDTLKTEKAWVYYRLGRITDAKVANDKLLKTVGNINSRLLDLQIAMTTGDWERFPAIVERELSHLDDADAPFLIQLAALAGLNNPDRAIDILKLAVGKAPEDVHVLLSAHTLAVSLGHDDLGMPWFSKARELAGEDGPIQKVDFKELVEMMPAHAERAHRINEAVLHGEIPLQVATDLLKLPLSRVLIGLPLNNEKADDARNKVVIPIRHGGRTTLKLPSVAHIAFDISSLMVMAGLDLLDTVIDAVGPIWVPMSTSHLILEEDRRVRYHQPSLIEEAKVVRGLIASGHLKVAPEPASKWDHLDTEATPDIAELLRVASETKGRVVRPLPIYARDSYMDREANLGEFQSFVLTTIQLVDILHDRAIIDETTWLSP